MIGVNPLWRAVLGGASAPVMPLRFVSPTNMLAVALTTPAAGQLARVTRQVHYIGSGDVSSLVLRLCGWYMGTGNTLNVGNAVAISAIYVKMQGGACVQATFSGSTSTSVADGVSEILSDALTPAQFGLLVFARNTKFFVTVCASVAANGLKFPRNAFPGGFTGLNCFEYDATSYSCTNLTGEDALTFTGSGGAGVSSSDGETIPVQVLGRFVGVDRASYMGLGDSITEGTGASTRVGNGGGSFFSRSLWPSDGATTGSFAGLNAGMPGGVATLWTSAVNGSNARFASLLKYANRYVDEFGINNIFYGSQSADSIYAAVLAMYTAIQAQPTVENGLAIKIARTSLLNRTSADGLTPIAGAGLGERLPAFNQKLQDQASIDFDSYINLRSIGLFLSNTPTDAANFQWNTTYATDGVHPTEAGHALIAASGVRSWIAANA